MGVFLWPCTFPNYTKTTKYEALEKNAVSAPKTPQLGDLHLKPSPSKSPLCWEIFGLILGGEIWASVVVAERVSALSVVLQRPTTTSSNQTFPDSIRITLSSSSGCGPYNATQSTPCLGTSLGTGGLDGFEIDHAKSANGKAGQI